ncbi:MAG: alpha/beta fold hydrolase [Thermomicrobiales bacterium]|nr:alpha/beta fold hydrolase [Thermomicrobiales bacterium]
MKHTINGAEIAFDDRGAGSALLLIHAGIADRRMWDAQVAAFEGTHRVVRFDMRGFGESSAPSDAYANYEDARGLLDALGIDRAVVAGDSMGGEAALDLALAYPDRVSGLVLISTRAACDAVSPELEAIWEESDEAFEAGEIEKATAIEVDGWIVGSGRTRNDVDREYLAKAEAMIRLTWERAAAGDDLGPPIKLDPPRLDRLAQVRVPTLLVTGDRDLPDIAESMHALAAGIAGARLVQITDTAHLPPLERPDEFNRHLREFLANHHLLRL